MYVEYQGYNVGMMELREDVGEEEEEACVRGKVAGVFLSPHGVSWS